MNAAPAREYLHEQTLSLNPEQFEQLCKMMLERTEKTKNPELTPFRQDGGIDVQALIDRRLYYADLGVQAKRYDTANTIGGPDVQRFAGALGSNDFNVGAFITTASFTKPAETESQQANMPIKLVDGDALTDILFENEIGIQQDHSGTYVRDHTFWDAFQTPEHTDVIPSLEVPQADSLQTLQIVLQAIDTGQDTKHEITEYVATRMNGFEPRQADYYGISGWLLGFLHKNTRVQRENSEIRRWGLTQRGQKYLAYIRNEQQSEADDLLTASVRDVEIVQRIRTYVESEQVVTRTEIVNVIEDETELNNTTAARREKSVRTWVKLLPEITVQRSGAITYQYRSAAERLTSF